MTIWIDAQLSPSIATWIGVRFGITAVAVRELGLRDAKDIEILRAAGDAEPHPWHCRRWRRRGGSLCPPK